MTIKIPVAFGSLVPHFIAGAVVLLIAAGLHFIARVEFPLAIMIGIGTISVCGALAGIAMYFNLASVFLKCPSCRSYGRVTFGNVEYFANARPILDCPNCGRLVNKSQWGGTRIEPEKETVCPTCGYEYKKRETSCPHCRGGK